MSFLVIQFVGSVTDAALGLPMRPVWTHRPNDSALGGLARALRPTVRPQHVSRASSDLS